MSRGKAFGLVFLGLGASLLWLGLDSPPIILKILLFLCSLASLSLGLAYFASRVGLLGKRHGGGLPVQSYLIFWPYHLVSYASLALARFLRVVPFQEIVPGLFLGGRLLSWEESKSGPLANASVLDLTSEFCEVRFLRRNRPYLCIPLLDGSAPTQAELELGVNFIKEQIQRGPVYVHCAMGHGRGATFALAYLVATGKMSNLDEALNFVRSKRPGVKIRDGQMNALKQFTHARRNL
jgi:hypothetical protein